MTICKECKSEFDRPYVYIDVFARQKMAFYCPYCDSETEWEEIE